MRKLFVFLLISLFVLPTISSAIIPFVLQGALKLSPPAARIAIGNFAAAGLATVINPTTNKTISMSQGNKSLKVSFGLSGAAHIAALTAFAVYSGYSEQNQSKGSCQMPSGFGGAQFLTKSECLTLTASFPLTYPYLELLGRELTLGGRTKFLASHAFYGEVQWGSWYDLGVAPVLSSSSDVMWLDNSINITQAKTDKIFSDIQAFSLSNPTDFDQIVELSAFASSQSGLVYSTASGQVTVSSDGVGGVTVSGGSSPSLTLDENSNILVDGLPPEPSVDTTIPPVDTTSPLPPTGSNNATGSDLGAVVTAINASKEKNSIALASLLSATTQASVDVASLQTAIESKQTDCEKFPDSVGCAKLGTDVSTSQLSTDVVDIGAAFSPVDVGQSSAYSCPPPLSGSLQGQPYQFSYQPICDVMGGVRPVVLAIAWFVATMVFVGGVRQ